MSDSAEQELLTLSTLSKSELSELWKQFFKSERPVKIRKGVLIRVIAYRLQEQKFGGMSNTQIRRLRQISSALESNTNATVSSRPPIKPGTRLVRAWNQQVYTVEVEAQGYQYKGDRYKSLSEIARRITGTRWSGPLFFGLKTKQLKASMEAR